MEELPLYLPSGSGEHLYIRVSKRGLSTPDLVKRLSSSMGARVQAIGVAGQKDARPVTTQMISLLGVTEERVGGLKTDERLLSVEPLGRHANLLRTGHHAGNRFTVVIREVKAHAAEVIPATLAALQQRGVPNYFGPQRQGREGVNYQIGAVLLQASRESAGMPKAKRLWFLHAFQAHLFNQVLAKRIARIDRMLTGDWAMKHVNGACFLVEDAEREQPRAEQFEISPTGPLFGSRAPWARGEPGALEQSVVAEASATVEFLARAAAAHRVRGERRAMRVKLEELDWSIQGQAVQLSFRLPPGAYATSLLREVMKIPGL